MFTKGDIMKKQTAFALLLAGAFIFGSISTTAAGAITKITAEKREDYTIKLDGTTQTFKDANGKVVYPIVYQGTTYLPVRALSEALDLTVGWDGNTQTVTLTTPKEETKPSSSSKPNIGDMKYDITYSKAVAETNSIGSVYTFGIVEVTNTGSCDLYLSSGKFDIEDKSGNLLASRSIVSVSPQVISPGEKAYYCEAMMLDGIEAGADLTIVPTVDIEKAKVVKKEYPVIDVKFTDAGWEGGRFIGRVENNTSEEISYIHVEAVLFDKDGKPLGVASTYITDKIAPNSKSGFDFTTYGDIPFSIDFDDVASYKIIAYGNQYQF